jgi:sugar phosphate isomerase/epimerase
MSPLNFERSRRAFLKDAAIVGGAAVAAGALGTLVEAAGRQSGGGANWKSQVGLEMFTVRDLEEKDFEGTLKQIAAIGYKEVEPASGWHNLEPKHIKAMLDRYGLSMPSVHNGASGATQAELEKVLEGYQVMGIKYTGANIGAGRGGGAARGAGAPGAPGAPAAAAGARGPGGAGGPAGPGGRGRGPQPPQTVDSVKQNAARLNEMGKIAQKFGMKILVHNHTQEFNLLDDGKTTQHEVVIRETDPALVAMQLDIGWASVAGQDILALFKQHPGRYELWHVKDAFGLKFIDPKLTPGDRMSVPMLVPVGLGEVDYKTIFASAQLAGLKHFCVEQDNAASWGDSMAAARMSYESLTTKVLA